LTFSAGGKGSEFVVGSGVDMARTPNANLEDSFFMIHDQSEEELTTETQKHREEKRQNREEKTLLVFSLFFSSLCLCG
jgi:hypothetical protein